MAKKRVPNKIQIVGAINEDRYEAFSEQLTELETLKIDTVLIDLSSGGGSAYDALAFYARMRRSPCDIVITAYGIVASAAVLVFAGGDVRKMTKESWVMVHEDSVNKLSADVTRLEKMGKHLRVLEDQWNSLLEERTGTAAEQWSRLHKRETYLSSEACLALGLVGEIV